VEPVVAVTILLLAGFAIAFGVIVFVAGVSVNKSVQKQVGDRHQILEEIVETGRVPKSWREKYDRKIARISSDSDQSRRLEKLRSKARRDYFGKLDRLRRYVEGATLVDGEETRRLVLDRLAEVRADWARDESAR
jgi:hypothetical protein